MSNSKGNKKPSRFQAGQGNSCVNHESITQDAGSVHIALHAKDIGSFVTSELGFEKTFWVRAAKGKGV